MKSEALEMQNPVNGSRVLRVQCSYMPWRGVKRIEPVGT